MARVAVYIRPSPFYDEGNQRVALARFLESSSLDITHQQEHLDRSLTTERPAWDRLVVQVRRGLVDVIVTCGFTRFARSAVHLSRCLQHLRDRDTHLIALDEDFNSLRGWAQADAIIEIVSAVAQFESDLAQERAAIAERSARQAGTPIGRPRLELDMKLIRELRDEGHSIRAIAGHIGVSHNTIRLRLQELESPP